MHFTRLAGNTEEICRLFQKYSTGLINFPPKLYFRMKRVLAIPLVIIFFAACVHNKYAATNKSYKRQVKNYAKLLREYPVKDSAGLQYADNWVGTTNFSMRRPNFVIIHHTAQD